MSNNVGYPQLGETVGPFRVERQLGVGGMGVVFAATDLVLNRQVALKVIAPQLAEDPLFRERFTREAQTQASLDSPHVVHVYAHGEAEGRLYIATQLVPGGDLGAMIQQHGAPPVRVALSVIGQVASGLAAAHAAGLIHRDLKPSNVLVNQRDFGLRDSGLRDFGLSAYLADFGIARRLDAEQSLTTVGATFGTPTYMAPELHTGASPGVATDVYSLGCLLWSTLAGQAPYGGTSDYQIVSAHFEQPIPQLSEDGPLARETNRVLRTAMAKHPEDRYPTAAAMRDDLLAVERLPDMPPPTAVPLTSVRRRGLPVLAVGVLLTVLAGLGAAFVLTRDDDEPSATESTQSTERTEIVPTGTAGATTPTQPPPADNDEQAAIDGLTEGFATTAGEAGARCIAEGVVGAVGVERLVTAGFFDEEWTFLNPDLAGKEDIGVAISTATYACVGDLLASGSEPGSLGAP